MKKSKNKTYALIIIPILIVLICISFLFLLSKGDFIYYRQDEQITNSLTFQYGDDYKLDTIKAHYSIFNLNFDIDVKQTNDIQDKQLGTYNIKLSPSFPFFMFAQTIKVNIIDTTKPVIELVDDDNYWIFPDEEYIEEGFTASDNFDGDITDKVTVSEIMDGKITYSVTDANGNKAEVIRAIKYRDTDPPVLTIDASYLSFQVGTSFNMPTYSAIDEKDGDLTSKVVVESDIDGNKVGCYQIKYSVSDRFDNKAEQTISVYVYRDIHTAATKQPSGKVLYLTYDDGPYKYTKQLLDLLDKYNVKATFFVTNSHPDYAYLIKEEAKRGHTIGVHTYTHNYQTIYSSEQAFWNDINKMDEVIYKQTGIHPNILRFAGGASNTVSKKYCTGIMTKLAASTSLMGYRYFDWNVSSEDAGGNNTADACFNALVSQCKNRTSGVVLQHDVKYYTLEATERFIQWALANGFQFLPITDTTPTVHHRIAN